jgi:2-phosphosulfolactate phosphatase
MNGPTHVLRQSLLTGAHEAEGLTVVIDVLRAFTSAALMVYLGAEGIILLADADGVLHLKWERGALAVGEVDGRQPAGFDLGNSPSQIMAAGRALFAGRMVAQRTTAGTRGALAAYGAGQARSGPEAQQHNHVILGSYVTASAIARYIQGLSPVPPVVSLVAMGDDGLEVTPDDEGCAAYIEHLLAGEPYDHATALGQIVGHECVQRFLRGDQAHFPPADPVYCLQRDLFDFVLLATLEDGYLVARRADLPGAERR